MADILFVYARHHPHISYKQGMHEILGPLIFVLHFDQEASCTIQIMRYHPLTQAFVHASEQQIQGLNDDARSLLAKVFNNRYLEHDS